MTQPDPIPAPARRELERLAQRWQTLPLARALPVAGILRELAQRYADEVADGTGRVRTSLPDLGPGPVLDQLIVTTYDVARLRVTPPTGADDTAGATKSSATNGSVTDDESVHPGGMDALVRDLERVRRRIGRS